MLSEACQQQSKLVDFEFAELRKKLEERGGLGVRGPLLPVVPEEQGVQRELDEEELMDKGVEKRQEEVARTLAADPVCSEPQIPRTGTRVMLHGLVAAASLNGSLGTIVEVLEAKARVGVLLDSGSASSGSLVSVKFTNIFIVACGPPPGWQAKGGGGSYHVQEGDMSSSTA